jgi:hypothetical protein
MISIRFFFYIKYCKICFYYEKKINFFLPLKYFQQHQPILLVKKSTIS